MRRVSGWHVHPQPRAHGHRKHGAARQPPRRPDVVPPVDAAQQVQVIRGKPDGDHAVEQLRTPKGQPIRPGQRLVQVVAQLDLHRREVRVQRRRGRRTPQRDGNTRDRCHHGDLDRGKPGKRTRTLFQLRQRDLAVYQPHQTEHEDAAEFDQDHPAIGVVQHVRQAHADQRIDHAGHEHDHERGKSDHGVAACGHLQVGAKPSPVRDQRHQPADPQQHEHQVPNQGVRTEVVVAARSRVPSQGQWHNRADRTKK